MMSVKIIASSSLTVVDAVATAIVGGTDVLVHRTITVWSPPDTPKYWCPVSPNKEMCKYIPK